MEDTNPPAPNNQTASDPRPHRPKWAFAIIVAVVAVLAGLITALLVSIFERKQEARNRYIMFVEVNETSTNPELWGKNWKREYDEYRKTAETDLLYGGSEGMTTQRLERDPWLKSMFAGYAFALDYREARGHAYMLADQEATERVRQRPQPGACLHCHASVVPTWRRIGAADLGVPEYPQADPFNWPAVQRGFEIVSLMRYQDANAELYKTPDGTDNPTAHPVSCIDCHSPDTMELRVTRPGLMNGLRALAESDAPVPHLPSIERWRLGSRRSPYDPNTDASRQEMRSLVCAQCHVEYYCGPKEVLFFPWHNGLKVEQIESYLEQHKFPDGSPFMDWQHAGTDAPLFKAQHPEFEIWSQGIHARSGVACADCHMPYKREGAMKVSEHWVRSPMLMVNLACQSCHRYPEQELQARVLDIQNRTRAQIDRAASAMVDMIDAIQTAKAAGATPEQLGPALELQRKATWRLDFVYAENSRGFHAPQETMRILAEATDMARQGQMIAQRLLMPTTLPSPPPLPPLEGVTPTEQAPTGGGREQENR